MSRESILAAISAERDHQTSLFTPQQDDEHSHNEWLGIIVRRLGLAASDGVPVKPATMMERLELAGQDESRFYAQVLRAAAVCVAALEAAERRTGEVRQVSQQPLVPQTDEDDRWQRLADQWQEPCLYFDGNQKDPTRHGEGGSNMQYACPLSQANAWERKEGNYTRRFEPRSNDGAQTR